MFNYTYDEVGNRSTAQREGGVVDAIGYDKNSQMTSYSLGGAVSSLTYDESGNRSKLVAAGVTTSYTSNGLNQYSAAGGSNLSYGANGNVTGYAGWVYSYDAMNRLLSADNSGLGITSDFYYDGLGRQVARKLNGVTIYSVWDGVKRVAEYAPGGSVTALNRCVYAGGDLVRSPISGQIYYYADGQGSTSYLSDGSGNLLEQYSYDVGGKPAFLSPTGATLTGGSAYAVDMLFTGQKWYTGYSILDLRARAYLPGLL